MKNLLVIAALCFATAAFAQNSKKDTTANEYGMRMYDTRTLQYMTVNATQTKENNPYPFANTAKKPADNPPKNITAK